MISVNDLKGLLEVNRIVVIPFVVAAYLSEWGFRHFPAWLVNNSVGVVVAFLLVILGSFVLSWLLFDLTLNVDYLVNKRLGTQVDIVYSLAPVSLISFGILGFFNSPAFSAIETPWHVAAGACGLYLLDVQRKVRQQLKKT